MLSTLYYFLCVFFVLSEWKRSGVPQRCRAVRLRFLQPGQTDEHHHPAVQHGRHLQHGHTGQPPARFHNQGSAFSALFSTKYGILYINQTGKYRNIS